MLDETCKKPGATEQNFCESVVSTHKKSNFYLEPRAAGFRQYRETQAFVVRHFAGDVCYLAKGFTEKNNDTLHNDFVKQLKVSRHSTIAKLYADGDDSGGGGGGGGKKGGGKKGGFNSVSRKYISQLGQLMAALNSTQAHFLRCIKPNKELKPSTFTPSLVLQQLRCSGTIDAVQLMAGGYPTRIPYTSIHGRYAHAMPEFVQQLPPPLFCESLALGLSIPADAFALGKTMIFFRAGKGAALEELSERSTDEVITMLTSNEAFMEKVESYQKQREALLKLQSAFRTRKMQLWLRQAVAVNKMMVNQELRRKARQQGMAQVEKKMLGKHGLVARARAALAKKVALAKAQEAAAAEEAASKELEHRMTMEAKDAEAKDAEAREAQEAARRQSLAMREPSMSDGDDSTAAGGVVTGRKVAVVTGQPVTEEEAADGLTMDIDSAPRESGAPAPTATTTVPIQTEDESPAPRRLSEATRVQHEFREAQDQRKAKRAAAAAAREERKNLPAEHTARLQRSAAGGFGIQLEELEGCVLVSLVQPGSDADMHKSVMEGDLLESLAWQSSSAAGADRVTQVKTMLDARQAIDDAGDVLVATLLRMQPREMRRAKFQLQVGADATWADFEFVLLSNLMVVFNKLHAPIFDGSFSLRSCIEAVVHESPSGGGWLQLDMPPPAGSLSLRTDDVSALQTWSREIHFLLPSLLARDIRVGWLQLRVGVHSRAKRYRVVLDSAGRLGYFTTQNGAQKKIGSIETHRTSLETPALPKHAFIIAHPEKDGGVTQYQFAAPTAEEQQSWLSALRSVMSKEAGAEAKLLRSTAHKGPAAAAIKKREAQMEQRHKLEREYSVLDPAALAAAASGAHADAKKVHEPTGISRLLGLGGGSKEDGVKHSSAMEGATALKLSEVLREGKVTLRIEAGGRVEWHVHWLVLSVSGTLSAYTMMDKANVERGAAKGTTGGALHNKTIGKQVTTPTPPVAALAEPKGKGKTKAGTGKNLKGKEAKKVRRFSFFGSKPPPEPERATSSPPQHEANAIESSGAGDNVGGGRGVVSLQDCTPVVKLNLQDISGVERSKGVDFHEFSIDINIKSAMSTPNEGEVSSTSALLHQGEGVALRFKPGTRAEMQAWLGSLQTSVTAARGRVRPRDEVVCTMMRGVLKVKSSSVSPSIAKGLLKPGQYRFFVLLARQEQQGDDDVEVRYTLLAFVSAAEAAEVAMGAALSLDGIEAVLFNKSGGTSLLTLRTADGELGLQADKKHAEEQLSAWHRHLECIRLGQDPWQEQDMQEAVTMYEGDVEQQSDPEARDAMLARQAANVHKLVPAAGVGVMAAATLKIARHDGAHGGTTWNLEYVELHTDGFLRWHEATLEEIALEKTRVKQHGKAEAEESDEQKTKPRGQSWRCALDVTHGVGVWLLGAPGWRRLQLVIPERGVTIASEDDELICEWCELLQDVCKGKRVREVHSGWVEKKNAMSERWKSVFLLLLSTHELLVMQSEQAAQPKHVLQLVDLAAVRSIDRYADDGYDHAFELVMGGEEPYTVEYCVDDAELREEWIRQLRAYASDKGGRISQHEVEPSGDGPPDAAGGIATGTWTKPQYVSSTRTTAGLFYLEDERGRLVHAKRARWHGREVGQQQGGDTALTQDGRTWLEHAHHRHERARGSQPAGANSGSKPLAQGWLFKCSQFDPSEWKRRFFILFLAPAGDSPDGDLAVEMHYYNSDVEMSKLRGLGGPSFGGVLELCESSNVKVRPDVQVTSWGPNVAEQSGGAQQGARPGAGRTLHKCVFEIKTPNRSYLLDAQNSEELQAWVEALENSRGVWSKQPSPTGPGS